MPIIQSGEQHLQDFSQLMTLVDREDNMLEKMDVFNVETSSSTLATFERRIDGTDTMYSVARDADRQTAGDNGAEQAHLELPFFTLDKSIKQTELLNLRKFGTQEWETVADKVAEFVARIQRGHALNIKKAMYTALKGSGYAPDQNGNPRPNLARNYQTVWNVPNSEMFNGAAGGAKTYDLTDQTANPANEFELFRQHVVAVAGDEGDNYEIVMLLGSTAFSRLKDHSDYVDAYANYSSEVEPARRRLGGLSNTRILSWQGVTFIEDISGEIATNEGYIFPLGMNLFEMRFGPRNTVNGQNEAIQQAYLYTMESLRASRYESETCVLAVVTRPELVGKYNFVT